MSEEPQPPQSLLAVTNWQSRALLPSEVCQPDFVEWAHDHGAHLYLVLVGPRTEIVALCRDGEAWKLRTLFHDGSQMRPRTIPVPFEILPEKGTELLDGVVVWIDQQGASHRSNAVEIVRRVLWLALRSGQPFGQWHTCTLKKFFTYQVEYIGQSFGKEGNRTAAERIGQGHKTVQQVLAEVGDLRPNSAVAFVALDAHVQGREMTFTISPDNVEDISALASQFMAEPHGPLVDKGKLVTAAEATLIRSFPHARNSQYKDFPLKDAPALVQELIDAGITHLGVQLDVSQSLALLQHPCEGYEPQARLRFAVNLTTGARETLQSSAPLTWQAD